MKQSPDGWKPTEPAPANAGVVLPDLIRDYFEAGRKLGSKSTAGDMHRFRLKTKRLRYTLEAFLPLYGPGLVAKAERLRPIQNALGDSNDCEVLLDEMGPKLSQEVRSYLETRAEKLRRKFLRYWRKEFDADGEERKWKTSLSRPKRTRSAKKK